MTNRVVFLLKDGGKAINDGYMTKWYNAAGQHHRLDGPATTTELGFKTWWINGLKHREDGPARIQGNGVSHWYLFGLRIDQSPIKEWLEENNMGLKYCDWTIEQKIIFKLTWAGM